MLEKTFDTPESLLDLVDTGGVRAADVAGSTRTKGITWNDRDPRLLQQPRREIMCGEFGRRYRREGLERPGRKMTGQPQLV